MLYFNKIILITGINLFHLEIIKIYHCILIPRNKLLGCPGDKKFGSKGPTALSPVPVSPNSEIGTFTSLEEAFS